MRIFAPVVIQQKGRSATVMKVMPFEIEEASDVPVSMTMQEDNAPASWDAPKHVFKLHEGRLWIRTQDYGGERTELTLEPRFDRHALKAIQRGHHPLYQHARNLWNELEAVDHSVKVTDEAILDSQAYREMLDAASRTRIFDGEFHERSHGPVLVLNDKLETGHWRARGVTWYTMSGLMTAFAYPRSLNDSAEIRQLVPTDWQVERAAPEVVGDLPDVFYDDDAAGQEAASWFAVWLLRLQKADKAGPEKGRLLADLRDAMERRWPQHRLDFDRSVASMWPHTKSTWDFEPAPEYEPLIRAIVDAEVGNSTERALLRIGLSRFATAPTLEDDVSLQGLRF